MFFPPRPTKKDVVQALQALESIERPYGDNEEDAINSDAVYPYLHIPAKLNTHSGPM